MKINIDYNDLIDNKYPTISILLDDKELNSAQDFVQMAKLQKIENPIMKFAKDTKSSEYDELSDEMFANALHCIKSLSQFWMPEKDGLLPAARQIYRAKTNDNRHPDIQYVMRRENDAESEIGIYTLLERFIAYVAWHKLDDTKMMANMDDCANALALLKDQLDSIKKQAAELSTIQNQGVDNEAAQKIADEQKNSLLHDIVANIETAITKCQKIHDTIGEATDVIDVTDDNAYNIPLDKDEMFDKIITQTLYNEIKSSDKDKVKTNTKSEENKRKSTKNRKIKKKP